MKSETSEITHYRCYACDADAEGVTYRHSVEECCDAPRAWSSAYRAWAVPACRRHAQRVGARFVPDPELAAE